MNKLKAWYASLQQREQRVVAVGAVALGLIIVIGGILMPLQSAVSSAIKASETRREDLAWMRVNAPEIRARGGDIPADTGEAPVVLVDRVGREVGLASSLRGTQPNTTGGVRVQLEAAPFDTLVTWLDTLDRRYGLAIESITRGSHALAGTGQCQHLVQPAATLSARGRRRRWPLILLGLIVLSGAVIFALPASFAARFMPAQVHAEDFSGSLLHGAAGKIRINARDAGAIEWQVHPLRLVAARDRCGHSLGEGGLPHRRHGRTQSRRFCGARHHGRRSYRRPADARICRGVEGHRQADVHRDQRHISDKLEAALGKIDVANISSVGVAAGSDLGSYELQLGPQSIAPDGSISATLNDTGGPVEAQAQIRFSPATRTGMLSGTLKERAEASPALRNQLNNLSQLRARLSGRFPVELEFTF